MKPCLVDVNVLLALLVPRHVHYKTAREWFNGLAADEAGLCRLVQLALIRLLGNRTIMGDSAINAATAWRVIAELLEDERLDFVAEPTLLDTVLPRLFVHPAPAANLVADAYLAAFAIADSRRFVTFDKGFRQFRGLETEILK
jgi:toxin-antitoxin system PIN domain toxin